MEVKNTQSIRKNRMTVHMFGGFSIEYNESPVIFARSKNTKFIQLLQILLVNYPQGISKELLINILYDRESGINNNKNLNNVIYRAKKQFVEAGLPEDNYVILENGICRWNSSFPVEVDVDSFEKKAKQALAETGALRKVLLEEAENLYTGEFLPSFATELWVIERNLKYKKYYEQIVHELGASLKEEGNYNRQLTLYRKAAKIYPYDQWQQEEMNCLISMKEYSIAYKLYEDTVRLYCEELGTRPGQEMVNRFHEMERQMVNSVGDFEDIRENLRRGNTSVGAFYCLYPSFLDICYMLSRAEERIGKTVFLMLINLSGYKRKEIMNGQKMETQMEILKSVIKETFRKGDVFTTYSKSQYIMVLIGSSQKNCGKVFERCLQRWKRTEGAWGELSYSAEALSKMINFKNVKPL